MALPQCCGVFGQSGAAGPIWLVVVFSFKSATPKNKKNPPRPPGLKHEGREPVRGSPLQGLLGLITDGSWSRTR